MLNLLEVWTRRLTAGAECYKMRGKSPGTSCDKDISVLELVRHDFDEVSLNPAGS